MVWGAVIGAGGALGSAGIGALASGSAADQQAQLNALAINEQRRQNLLQRMFAERILAMQLEGQTDAFGNRTRYVPGMGFVTELDPTVQTLQNASLQEQLRRQTEDAPRIRRGQRANERRRADEAGVADVVMGEMQRASADPITQNELFQLILSSGNQAFQREQDRALQQVLRQSMRSGGSNAADILADFASAGADRRRDAGVQARLQAITGADEINLGRRSNLSNLYNMFATRAANISDAPVGPENISNLASTMGGQVGRNALGGQQLAAGLMQGRAPSPVAMPSANMGWANAFGSGADAISGLFEYFSRQQGGGGGGSSPRLGNQATRPPRDITGGRY